MNIVEILTNLFSFENNSEAVVFYSIIFLALLLGIFFAYLLVTRPILRKKRKQISGLQSDLEMANSKIKLSYSRRWVLLREIYGSVISIEEKISTVEQETNVFPFLSSISCP
jgi:hypothetical protein